MAAFRFEAVDAQGRLRQGLLDAENPRVARDRLRADGLVPTAVEPAPERPDTLSRMRLPAAALALFTRQLATLVHAGMPLDQALLAVGEQADDPRVATLVAALRTQVMAGEPLPSALARFPRSFAPLYRGLVGAGTETGRLSEVLGRLADYLDARLVLRQKFTVALIYPALVTIIALGVIAVLLTYVVPQVVSVYQQSRQTLPPLTRALIATSAFFRATGWFWLAAVAALAVAAVFGWRFEIVRERVHRWLLRLPGAGRLAASLDAARYASTLAILVGSGAPLLRSLSAATDVIRLIPLARAGRKANVLVREGVSLSRALKDQAAFPPVLIHLIANGEQSGALAPMLERAAQELEREAERRLAWLAALIQPTLIVAMGAIVLVLVLAVMLPIVTMNQLVR
ncbi:MAG: type II secretion system inner membrane protein GspF [Betaproteobacteria bacterium]|nr:type II secretion system inner membrane protein GspF [Betaproteobacteria bacterium]MDE2004005.1 type II secretion system inner membrane protein GspF [Betaproteobacteria bacterium]MDE2209515.1 type II secretion system inner membrane protein GspF [Betaproteobacteria bacterium]